MRIVHHIGRRISIGLTSGVLLAAGTLTGVAGQVAAAPAAEAATQVGNDISWPQCSVEQGGYGNPMPAPTTGFVVLGLTHGLALTSNPCLAEQARWVRDSYRPFHAYTMASYPTRAQITRYGSTGPFPAATYLGKIRNVGYAEGAYAVNTLRGIGLRPPRLWIDVEHRKAQPWVSMTGNPTAAIYNRAVLEGMLAAFRRTEIPVGFYSNADGWATITDNWQVPGVPFWATAGPRGQAAAEAMCAATGLNGGPVHLAQWWTTSPAVDWNVACAGHAFAAPKVTLSWPTISSTRSRLGSTNVVLSAGPSRRQTWQFTVTDACTGKRVTQVGGVTSDKMVVTWRGRRADGTRVPAGTYRLTLRTGTRTPPTGPAYAPLHQILTATGKAAGCTVRR